LPAGEQDHPGQALLEPPGRQVGQAPAREADHHDPLDCYRDVAIFQVVSERPQASAEPVSAPAAVIAVPVADVWSAADAARQVDRYMTAPRPAPAAWMAAMSLEELLGLHGRLGTQALMDEPVVVVSERSGWAEVELPLQPSRKGARGYPGWVRCEHLGAPYSVAGTRVVGPAPRYPGCRLVAGPRPVRV
jgi:hypothetical protein